MYTTKFRSWGWRKNLNSDDVLKVLEHAENTGFEANAGGVSVMGSKRLKQYLRRNGKAKQRFLARQSHPSAGLTLVGPLQDTEVALSRLREYIDYCLSSGTWIINPDGSYRGRHGGSTVILFEAWGRFNLVTRSLERFEDVPILGILDSAFRGLRQVIKQEFPRACSFLLAAIKALQRLGRSDLANITLKFLCSASQDIFGEGHPLPRLWTAISKLPFASECGPFEAIFSLFLRELASRLGQCSPLLASVTVDYFDGLITAKDTKDQFIFLSDALKRMSMNGDRSAGCAWTDLRIRHYTVLQVLSIELGMDEETDEIWTQFNLDLPKWLRVLPLRLKAELKLHSGDLLEARELLLDALSIALEEVGRNLMAYHWILPMLWSLEQISVRMGQSAEAQGLKMIRVNRIQVLTSLPLEGLEDGDPLLP